MIVIDSLLRSGLNFVFDKIATAVDRELDDEEVLRERLLEAQMARELGEIDEDELARIEDELLPRLRAISERRRAAAPSGPLSGVTGVEISAHASDRDEEPDDEGAGR